MLQGVSYFKPHQPAPLATWDETAFELFDRIPPVVLVIREGVGVHAMQFNHAGRLMRQLDSIGKNSQRILGIHTGETAADIRSVRALNCFLRYGPGLETFRRTRGLYRCAHPWHKFGWIELKRHLALKFR